jgi:selenoprotein W-related protein
LLKLKQDIGALRLVPTGGGAFEVSVNGQNIYSKLQTGNFPEADAVLKKIRAMRG